MNRDKYYFIFKKDKIIGYTADMNLLNKYFDDRLNLLDADTFKTYSVVFFDNFDMIPDKFLAAVAYDDNENNKSLVRVGDPFSSETNSYYVISDCDDKICADYVQEFIIPKVYSYSKDILRKMKYVNLSESEKKQMVRFKDIVNRYFKDLTMYDNEIYDSQDMIISFRKVFELLLRRGLVD